MMEKTVPPSEKHSRHTGFRLSLELGMRISLSLGPDHDKLQERFAATIVGSVHFECLIVRLPWVPGLRPRLINGAVARIRFVHEGELCGFQTHILTYITKPALLLFLQYPDSIETLPLRQYKRVPCALLAQLSSQYGDAPSVISDISRGGCRLAFDARGQCIMSQIAVDDKLVIRISLAAEGMPLAVRGIVRNMESDPDRILLGVAFTESDEAFWASLDFFLSTSELLTERKDSPFLRHSWVQPTAAGRKITFGHWGNVLMD